MKYFSCFALAALMLTASGLFGATTIVRGPYLQLATPDSMIVRWRTDMTERSFVRYGTSPEDLAMVARAEGVKTEHVVQLVGLQPDTRYFYAVGGALEKTADGKLAPVKGAISDFRTPPVAGTPRPARIWVLGDPGTKNTTQAAVRDAYYKFTGDRATDLWLMLGDNAYPDGTDADFQKAVFEMYPETLRTSPLWSALGNHDARSANSITQSGVYYDIFSFPTRGQAGGVASGTEAYYSFDFGNTHFICLDSQDTDRRIDGAMAQWLKADIADTKRDWIVAFFHHPTYTKGTHDSDNDADSEGRMNDMRQTFLPILEAGGVDLVMTGHSHNYERSFFLDGHYGKSDTFNPAQHVKQKTDGRADGSGVYRKPRARMANSGEVSVVAGSAGHAAGYTIPLNHPVMFVSLNEAGSVVLDIDRLRLDFTFLNERGEKRDWFSIVKDDSQTVTDKQR